jgi:RNA polymerase sigma factor (sigma-70 family)
VSTVRDLDALLRPLVPQAVAVLARRNDDFAAVEDAVQEALVAATVQWPREGVPDNPRGWLTTVAARRLTDRLRSERAGRERAARVAALEPPDRPSPTPGDDTLTLLLHCCHRSLTPSSQVALTLRAVGGLTIAEVAAAFLVPEATMAQRIARAKQTIRDDGGRFEPPDAAERPARLRAVLHVLYLVFNEGYTASSGERLQRVELTAEAIRLTRLLHRLLPDDGEVAGLLALMLLTDARRPARTTADGDLVPLAEQDRARWDRALLDEGLALTAATLASAPVGPYQLQAAIAAVHAEAATAEETDWPQVAALYGLLAQLDPSPVVTLNRAVAVAMADGPAAGLALLEPLGGDRRLAAGHRLHAVRAHLHELAGEHDAALAGYRAAAARTTSIPEQRYLLRRAAALS